MVVKVVATRETDMLPVNSMSAMTLFGFGLSMYGTKNVEYPKLCLAALLTSSNPTKLAR